ncbi:hypothetical protein BDK51DRAFT_27633 [Blyttiomyces helicus]|uniref:UspA domain-containing protein n=1 Tax=Blyttiomyces helicus TaxID=388810 RepID=A0A4P9W8Q8_9FUNG|nr:hypothetical protein BDK51DRAFT_27633 [Blyttiomyces helicus]|eukprot:RKO88921.1 hypothetical protein BDK51DRAFT_27633 [Blyttiomyces helicus]
MVATHSETLHNATSAATGKTVAFALDESPDSVSALQWTFDYILSAGDKLVVLSVAQDSVTSTTSRVLVGEAGKVGEILCAEVRSREGGFGRVEKVNPAMLILGSSSKSQMTGFLVGSVSQYAVRKASVPVIVARVTPTL